MLEVRVKSSIWHSLSRQSTGPHLVVQRVGQFTATGNAVVWTVEKSSDTITLCRLAYRWKESEDTGGATTQHIGDSSVKGTYSLSSGLRRIFNYCMC